MLERSHYSPSTDNVTAERSSSLVRCDGVDLSDALHQFQPLPRQGEIHV